MLEKNLEELKSELEQLKALQERFNLHYGTIFNEQMVLTKRIELLEQERLVFTSKLKSLNTEIKELEKEIEEKDPSLFIYPDMSFIRIMDSDRAGLYKLLFEENSVLHKRHIFYCDNELLNNIIIDVTRNYYMTVDNHSIIKKVEKYLVRINIT